MIEQVRSGHGQGTSTEYVITNEHRISPPGNPIKGNDLEEDRREDGEMNNANIGMAPSGR